MVPIDYNGFWSFVCVDDLLMLMTSGEQDVNPSIASCCLGFAAEKRCIRHLCDSVRFGRVKRFNRYFQFEPKLNIKYTH